MARTHSHPHDTVTGDPGEAVKPQVEGQEKLPGVDDIAPKPRRIRDRRKPPETHKAPGRPKKTVTQAALRDDVQLAVEQIAAVLAVASLRSPKFRYDAEIVGANAAPLAAELVKMAERMPWLERALRSLSGGAESLRLAQLLAGIAVPILANHGALPASFAEMMGAPPIPAEGLAAVDDEVLATLMDLHPAGSNGASS